MGTKSMFSMPGDAVASPAAPREEKDRWPNTRQKRADVIVRFRLPRYRLGRLQLRRRVQRWRWPNRVPARRARRWRPGGLIGKLGENDPTLIGIIANTPRIGS